jgi:hypothetical protein
VAATGGRPARRLRPSVHSAAASARPGAAIVRPPAAPDAGLLAAILDGLDEIDRRRLRHRRVMVVAAAGAVVLARRRTRGAR